MEQLNASTNAFITMLPDQARHQAKDAASEIAAGAYRGPLHGIPIAIKDFYDTAGIRTTAAFEHFQHRIPQRDAVSVKKLKDAGAIIVGKTNMHRLGMGTTGIESAYGPVLNPWNADYIAGGSSAGSAAAVASGMCHATLDTDAIGSCRLPASCCGVVGFKGTYGLIDAKGILELALREFAGKIAIVEQVRGLQHINVLSRQQRYANQQQNGDLHIGCRVTNEKPACISERIHLW